MMKTQLKRLALIGSMPLLVAACGDGDDLPEDRIEDSGMMDAGHWDAGPLDGRAPEAGGDASPDSD